jgi:uncharacterized membrane protein YkgB
MNFTPKGGRRRTSEQESIVNLLAKILTKTGLLRDDLDYHLVHASMVLIFFFFGYQKWFAYEAQTSIPFISHGPLIFWMYPILGIRGASWLRMVRLSLRFPCHDR